MEEPRIPTKPIAGEIVMRFDHPVWEPLLYLLGEDLTGGFMWMGEIRLADGTALHAYKHRDTRRYIHLTADGRAFYNTERGTYKQIEIIEALQAAMRAVFRTPIYYWDPEYRWEKDPDEPHPPPDFGEDVPF